MIQYSKQHWKKHNLESVQTVQITKIVLHVYVWIQNFTRLQCKIICLQPFIYDRKNKLWSFSHTVCKCVALKSGLFQIDSKYSKNFNKKIYISFISKAQIQ